MDTTFEWDKEKNQNNIDKHGVSFNEAQFAFNDPYRLIYKDIIHSTEKETRYYCLGKIGSRVCTVRFTYRDKTIRIFGAGYWRREQKIYEKQNQAKNS